MKREHEGIRLRIYIHEGLRHGRRPLYQALVEHARRFGMAGATVFHGIEAYGQHHHLHTARLVDVSDDLPVIIEIVDSSTAVQRFLPSLDAFVSHGTVTLSPVNMVTYRPGNER